MKEKLDLNKKIADLGIFSFNEIQKLSKLNLHKAWDLLFYLPLRYEDKTFLTPIADLKIGDKVLIEGTVSAANYAQNRSRNFIVQLDQGSSSAYLRFINYYQNLITKLVVGSKIRAYGEVRQGYYGLEIVHPQLTFASQKNQKLTEVADSLTPIYSTIASVQQFFIRNCTKKILNLCVNFDNFDELLPADLIAKYNLPNILQALKYVHFPPPDADKQQLVEFRSPAQIRLIFEELLARQLSLLTKRATLQKYSSQAFVFDERIKADFLKSLEFEPTNAQITAFREIMADMQKNQPMLRLLQGDVGSGKTLVAALAILQVVKSGFQAVIMAPTEILANQHFDTFKNWFEKLGFTLVFLAGKQKAAEKKIAIEKIATGACDLVVGTHALIQKNVVFKNLALSVIDEQHRFGVNQREELFLNATNSESFFPHQLIMTATPIPRTLAMTIYADLEVSILNEMPKNRQPIKTFVMPMNKRNELIKRLNAARDKGLQIFWVCALVSESETINCKAAEDTFDDLVLQLQNFKIGLVHGRQKAKEKENTMEAFRKGDLDLLVSTSVIEVGVDIPKAGVMIIDNAERFGLSQLHQLRGRVGRGSKDAFCILLYKAPLSPLSASRLSVIRNNNNGFKIAEADLKIRGEGDMLGKLQAGKAVFKIASVARDLEYFAQLQIIAEKMFSKSFKTELLERWQTEIFLS